MQKNLAITFFGAEKIAFENRLKWRPLLTWHRNYVGPKMFPWSVSICFVGAIFAFPPLVLQVQEFLKQVRLKKPTRDKLTFRPEKMTLVGVLCLFPKFGIF
jgi:hypothetical protein